MILVEAVLGSAADEVWADRLRAARVDVLRLDQAETQKSRLRKTVSSGAEVAVSLDRGTQLRDGDVLFWDEQERIAIVTQVNLTDVMVIDLMPLIRQGIVESLAVCFELGHALGNQHWAAVVKGLRVYVPLAVSQVVMNSVMKTRALDHVTWTFMPGAEVAARLDPQEARRLFGAVPAGNAMPAESKT